MTAKEIIPLMLTYGCIEVKSSKAFAREFRPTKRSRHSILIDEIHNKIDLQGWQTEINSEMIKHWVWFINLPYYHRRWKTFDFEESKEFLQQLKSNFKLYNEFDKKYSLRLKKLISSFNSIVI